jgi:hypothetical protein
MTYLSDSGRAQLRIQHKKDREGPISDRIKAVLLYDHIHQMDFLSNFQVEVA